MEIEIWVPWKLKSMKIGSDRDEDMGKELLHMKGHGAMELVVILLSPESETEDEPQAGNLGCCKTNSFIHSSSLPHPPGFDKDGCDREAGRLPSNRNMGIESEPENFGSSDDGGKRKRGRSPKNINVEIKSTPKRKKPPRGLKSNEVENIMLNTILENGNAGLESCMPSVAVIEASTSLPLKFRYMWGIHGL